MINFNFDSKLKLLTHIALFVISAICGFDIFVIPTPYIMSDFTITEWEIYTEVTDVKWHMIYIKYLVI